MTFLYILMTNYLNEIVIGTKPNQLPIVSLFSKMQRYKELVC